MNGIFTFLWEELGYLRADMPVTGAYLENLQEEGSSSPPHQEKPGSESCITEFRASYTDFS